MTDTKHTPGPWYFDGRCVRSFDPKAGSKHLETDNFVASVCSIPDGPLIAAAPDLLEALREAIEWDGCDEDGVDAVWLRKAHAAIAKAKGQAND